VKRDNDLIRSLLLEFESADRATLIFPDYAGKDSIYSKRHYHVQLLCDSGFLCREGKSGYRISNSGHDFLDAMRDEGIWKKTKDTVAISGGNATLGFIKQIATALLKKQIRDRTGLDV
jgi:hypothetical protein